ncbi:MAG: arsenosugar biosynthesis radical SAM protein ArsS [Treponemataceae bacterium]
MSDKSIHEQVKEYYGVILKTSDDLKTNACCTTSAPPKYVKDIFPKINDEIIDKFYGCGSPIPMGLEGCTALDLGCGSGRDVYILSKLVGEKGYVHGVDMTEAQIAVAKKYQKEQAKIFGYKKPNTSFHFGYIEDLKSLGIKDNTIDVVTSNCVINLSPFKKQIFQEVYRVLKVGGELCFSDVFVDRRLPDRIKNDPVMYGECMGGSMYIEDFRRLMEECGFTTYYTLDKTPIQPNDFEIARIIGDISFFSCTVRAFKCSVLEDREEDYGHSGTYLGSMSENKRYFDFDEQLRFVKNKPVGISRNIANIILNSRFNEHFKVDGAGVEHKGLFSEISLYTNPSQYDFETKVTLDVLNEEAKRYDIPNFNDRLKTIDELYSKENPSIMQVNVGYKCNLACNHCFLGCNSSRTEMMSKETMDKCLKSFKTGDFKIMDITGGSPEMNPHIQYFIEKASAIGDVIVRTNLTILKMKEYANLMDVYKKNKVKLICSLPYYNESVVDNQRGGNVFKDSIQILKELNQRGYGSDEQLHLTLVYNTDGPYLPPNEAMLERTYKETLFNNYGIVFSEIIAIGNVPLGRFAQQLKRQGKLGSYIKLQSDNFHEDNVPQVMCRNQINVDYDGSLYDCEYYHVLGIKPESYKNIDELINTPIRKRQIKTSVLCYSCTAGYGSSCGGSLTN